MKWIVSSLGVMSVIQLALVALGFTKKFEQSIGEYVSRNQFTHVDILNIVTCISIIIFVVGFVKEYRGC